MTINLSSSLAGLSLLSGTNSFLTYGTPLLPAESAKARQAHAFFVTPATTPPWKETPTSSSTSTQLSAISAMKTIIDTAATGADALPGDVQTAFATYKALDRLRLLAETAASTTISASTRKSLNAVFAKGLDDLQTFLAKAPGDQLHLTFAEPSRSATSVAIASPASLLTPGIAGVGVAAARDAPLAGLTGTEKFRIGLSSGSSSDSVTVDLTGTVLPPTLDSVAAAINGAIAAIPLRNPDGSVVLDAQGQPTPRWLVRFMPDKSSGQWGLAINRSSTEKVQIDQVGGGDALMIAAGTTSLDAPTATRIMRLDDPAAGMGRQALATIAAVDSDATTLSALVSAAKASAAKATATTNTTTAAAPVTAATTARGIVADGQGNSYVVGVTSGDLGANLSDGSDDLFLSKLDSEGNLLWQRSLGANSAQGSAISLAPGGGVVVAGTVKGAFDGAGSDGDMLVARFDANGDETFSTLVRAAGSDRANAVAVGGDGTIFVGGSSATGNGDAFLARLDAAGHLQERRTIDSGGTDAVSALAVDQDGQLLVATREGGSSRLRRLDAGQLSTELGNLDLGSADARAIAVADDGSIAVGGATLGVLNGTQVNTTGGGRDGFVARIDRGLSSASVTYIATPGEDQVDSVAFLGGTLYAGGRTAGALDGARRGPVDGFVARLDPASGAVAQVTQFGLTAQRTEPVQIAAAPGNDTALGALGLHRGTLTPETSAKLVAQTSLRAGDEFSVRVNGGVLRKIVIGKDDTLTTLADRVRAITGSKATVTTPKKGTGNALTITAKAGMSIDFIAGADGKDALAKLGIPQARILASAVVPASAPRVRPGGSFGLGLTGALAIATQPQAAVTLASLKQAISISQTGYRSLYWDDTKAALVNGGTATAALSSRQSAQLAQYQSALDRLTPVTTTTDIWGF